MPNAPIRAGSVPSNKSTILLKSVGFNTNKKAILLAILLRELKVSNNASVTLPFRRMKSGGAARRDPLVEQVAHRTGL